MGGGTEAFPDLGRHCQHSDCNQLDFLPFSCDGCHKVFCLDHRSCKSHECPNPDHKSRTVIVCEACSAAIETTGSDEILLLEKHAKSGTCDPGKKKKPSCPVKRCKEVLTFSNSSVCKSCHIKVCLGHRFPADHACPKLAPAAARKAAVSGGDGRRTWGEKFLAGFVARNGRDCGTSEKGGSVSTKNNPSVKAC